MSDPIRIVHYIPKFSPAHWGGAEEAIIHLSRELVAHGFRSEVWTNTTFSDGMDERIEGLVVRRFRGFFLSKSEREAAGLGKAPVSLGMLARLGTVRGIDLLHVHSHNRAASMLIAVARARSLPTVVSLHSELVRLVPSWRYRFQNEFAVRHADHVIAVTNRIRHAVAALTSRSASDVTMLPNGVVAGAFEQGNGAGFRASLGLTDEPLVLSVGRINDTKNQKASLDVLPLVNEALGSVHWAIVGFPSDAGYFEELRREISRRGLDGVMHLIPGMAPRSQELVDAYAAADVAVIPSRHEPFGIVLLEAWASRTPVIATNSGGPAELIHDGVNGLLVDVSDHRRMAERIVQVLADPTFASKLVAEAADTLPAYEWPAIAEDLASVYRTVLARSLRGVGAASA
jgi:glycosyltransferase involved in cell wall biosynthesis